MAETRSERPKRRVLQTRVRDVRRLTPHLIRVVVGGEDLEGFAAGTFTDHYVKLLFPPPGATYAVPYDVEQVRAELPPEQWPVTRTYTVRAWDAHAGELTIDFVHHGDEGLAGPWAAAAAEGDEVLLLGPGGAYSPDPAAAFHLFAGDLSALPAIAVALERLPATAVGAAVLEVPDATDEVPLEAPDGVPVTWLHTGERRPGERLVDAVRGLAWPGGDVQAFVHGEAGAVREMRRYLRIERGMSLDRLSVSGYWRLGVNDEGWRAGKREWAAQVEQDEAVAEIAG